MRKIKITAILTCMVLILTGICGCGKSQAPAAQEPVEEPAETVTEETPADVASEAETEPEFTAEEDAAAEEDAIPNMLVIRGPSYTGLTNLTNENNADGTYLYEDMTEDGLTFITNFSAPNSQRDGQAPDAYAENFICALIDNDARILETKQDEALTSAFTYPVYKVSWESGSNEDSRQAIGAVVLTDLYTYYYGFECPLDFYEDNAEFYEDELGNIELMGIGDAADTAAGSGDGYEALYLDTVNDLYSEGLADQFSLATIDEDDIPELIASDSEGSFDHENTFVYTVSGGKAVLLSSGTSGIDGFSLSYCNDKNLIRESYGLAGETQIFSQIKDGKLSETFRAEMTDTFATDADDEEIYTYSINGSEVDEASYYKEIAAYIKDFEPMTRIDYDGLCSITYKTGDGYGSFEVTDSSVYCTFDEIKELLK